jgi:hypothetical protein
MPKRSKTASPMGEAAGAFVYFLKDENVGLLTAADKGRCELTGWTN